jgi:sulfatase-like protein
MPPAVSALASRFPFADRLSRQSALRGGLIALPHLVALAILLATEDDLTSQIAFVLGWGLLNCFWLTLFRRPGLAGALSLTMIVLLILLSQLKHGALFMTVNFVDLMIIDWDTIGFLLTVMPTLSRNVLIAALITLPAAVAIWWLDPLRVRRRSAALGFVACLGLLTAIAFAFPSDPEAEFYGAQYVSKFARSAVTATTDYLVRGIFDSDRDIVEHLKAGAADMRCTLAKKPPHIVMIFDESSFDATNMPGTKVPANYRAHFTSVDGKSRAFVVEGAGGPSWFTEYNVLTGLSVRSYGRFADFVTRIAAGRVERGLPWALRRCGYKTYSLYSFLGAFLSARRFQETAGIENFQDAKALGASGVDPDGFFFEAATRVIEANKNKQPLFLFVYTLANHFPWSYRFRPDLTPGWQDYGNDRQVDEYLRRQMLSGRDYKGFVAKLRKDYPGESFLIVRFGDHLPGIALPRIEPGLDEAGLAQLIKARDPRYFTTYYAIDAVNFQPADMSSALPRLDAPYLPIVVMEAAGLPLDPSFAEQKRIMDRCYGQFYQCAAGAEVRRFNRMLIEAGLIKGL